MVQGIGNYLQVMFIQLRAKYLEIFDSTKQMFGIKWSSFKPTRIVHTIYQVLPLTLRS